jgi:hypothetical protein
MVAGHEWEYTSTFQGRVNCLNPDGSKAHVGVVTLAGDPSQGEVELTVDGNEYVFQGVGKHEVRDPKSGELYGYVDMAPAPSHEEMEKEWSDAPAGHRGTKLGSEGFNKTRGYSWEMRGSGRVTIENPDGTGGGTVGSNPKNAPAVPTLTVTTKDGTITKQGYGTYEIPGADGKMIVKLTIEPDDSPK